MITGMFAPQLEINSTVDEVRVFRSYKSMLILMLFATPMLHQSGPSNCTKTDICPDTESNATVDTYGCSWNQRDDDGDGVSNQL